MSYCNQNRQYVFYIILLYFNDVAIIPSIAVLYLQQQKKLSPLRKVQVCPDGNLLLSLRRLHAPHA